MSRVEMLTLPGTGVVMRVSLHHVTMQCSHCGERWHLGDTSLLAGTDEGNAVIRAAGDKARAHADGCGGTGPDPGA